MFQLTIQTTELWDERLEQFIQIKGQTLQLEHSLVSISKWESKWNKPFLSKQDRTYEESLDYIRCMTLTQNVDPNVYFGITDKQMEDINQYINAPMTATTFSDDPSVKKNREIITSELIYYWMIAMNIPPDYQKWHLNRLLTLIQVCSVKNTPPKKRSRKEMLSRNAELNAARRKKLNSKG